MISSEQSDLKNIPLLQQQNNLVTGLLPPRGFYGMVFLEKENEKDVPFTF